MSFTDQQNNAFLGETGNTINDTIHVYIGSTVFLVCPNLHQNNEHITWSFKPAGNSIFIYERSGNKTKEETLNRTLEFSDDGYHLMMKNISSVDKGTYECFTNNQRIVFNISIKGKKFFIRQSSHAFMLKFSMNNTFSMLCMKTLNFTFSKKGALFWI